MYGTGLIDEGNEINWGNTSEDYIMYRPAPPKSFFNKLFAHGIGVENQKLLDLGTGVGHMAIEFAKNGSVVTGMDISEKQIKMAKMISEWECLKIHYIVAPCEKLPFTDHSFDIITANQCWLYFDQEKIIPEIKRVLKPNGKLMVSHFSWLPYKGGIANESEKLILKYNPSWSAAGYQGIVPVIPSWSMNHFNLETLFYYDEEVPFSKKSWMGRVRASRGIGASLSQSEVKLFDLDHKNLLDSITTDHFYIRHRIDAHIFSVA